MKYIQFIFPLLLSSLTLPISIQAKEIIHLSSVKTKRVGACGDISKITTLTEQGLEVIKYLNPYDGKFYQSPEMIEHMLSMYNLKSLQEQTKCYRPDCIEGDFTLDLKIRMPRKPNNPYEVVFIGKHSSAPRPGTFDELDFGINSTSKLDKIWQDFVDNVKNEKDARERFQKLGKGLSFEEKMNIVSYFGQNLLTAYDVKKSTRGHSKASSIVSFVQLMQAMRTGKTVVDCRDIASSHAQMLKWFGVDNVYVLINTTAQNKLADANQAIVAVSDPNNPEEIHNINYNNNGTSKTSTGTSKLLKDSPIPTYDIYNELGVKVSKIDPSVEAAIKRKVLRDIILNPYQKGSGHLRKLLLQSVDGEVQANVFMGTDQAGAEYRGLATNSRNSPKRTLPHRRIRPDGKQLKLDSKDKESIPTIKSTGESALSKIFELKDGSVSMRFSSGIKGNFQLEDVKPEGSIPYFDEEDITKKRVGGGVAYEKKDSIKRFKLQVIEQYFVTLPDAGVPSEQANKIIADRDNITAKFDYEREITQRVSAFINVAAEFRPPGEVYKGSAGFNTPRGTQFKITGRFSKAPKWVPDSTKQVGARATFDVFEIADPEQISNIEAFVEYTRDLETDDDIVTGGFKLKL